MVAIRLFAGFRFVTGRALVMDGGRTLPRFPRIALPD